MRVGIALAAYQPRISYFVEQLQSLQDQTHKDWICVVTLDPGADAKTSGASIRTLQKHPEMAPFFADSRLAWQENEKRLGHKKNFERAIQLALSHPGVEAIACSDQDDVWYPEKLARSVESLRIAGPLALVHTDMHALGSDGLISRKSVWAIEHRGVQHARCPHLLIRNVVAGCSMLFDAELARRFPNIPEGAEFHDHWYALVASLHGGVHPVPEPLYAYRQHGDNEVGVTPFIGTFTLPQGLKRRDIFQKCRKGWLKSNAFALSARREGVPLRFWHRVAFTSRWDFGLGILLMGLFYLATDRPLARACLARGAGKLFSNLSLQGIRPGCAIPHR